MLPAAASFKRQGANRGALSAFLVTTPESGVDSVAITYALLDPIMTVVRPVAACVTGLSAGFLENALHNPDSARRPPSPVPIAGLAPQATEQAAATGRRWAVGVRYALVDVWGDIVGWFFIGLLAAGIITAWLPAEASELVLGGGLISMLTMLAVGMPIYICATASTPVAAALLLKGASPGAVLVFLLAGPATNLTSLSVLMQVLGKWGTLRYLVVVATVSVLFGLGVDLLYTGLRIEPRAVIGEAAELVPDGVKVVSAIFLLLLSAWHVLRRFRRRKADGGCFGRSIDTAISPDAAAGGNRSGRHAVWVRREKDQRR